MSNLVSHPVVIIENIPPKTTPAQAVSLLINSAVGAGVLSLGFAFSLSGYVGGLIILCCVAAIESYTLYILSRWAESTGASSYGELVHHSLGKSAAATLSLVLFFYLFGSSVAYLVILGDSFHPLIVHFFGNSWFTTRRTVIATVGTALVFPLCFGESITSAAGISVVNFVAFVAVIATIMARSIQTILGQDVPFAGAQRFSSNWLGALPIMVFSLQCHAQVVAVFNELTDGTTAALDEESTDDVSISNTNGSTTHHYNSTNTNVNENRLVNFVLMWPLGGINTKFKQHSPKITRMTSVIIKAIAITALGYALVGITAYLAFPTTIQSNVLNTFSQSDHAIQVARAVVGVLEIASYPVNHFPARTAIKDFIHIVTGWEISGNSSFIYVETALFYFASLALALFVNDLGAVFTLVGGTCGSIIILGLPGLLLMSYSFQKHRVSRGGTQQASVEIDSEVRDPLLSSADGVDEEAVPRHDGQHERRQQQQVCYYNVWESKLFWGGAVLTSICTILFSYTVFSVFA